MRPMAGRMLATACMFLFFQPLSACISGPCDPPPYDPLVPVESGEAALAMDAWARKALRRDLRGGTCPEQQEVVDILLVRWLQAHPEIIIAFEQEESADLLAVPSDFLNRLKAEAWAALKGRRGLFPRAWGRPQNGAGSKVIIRKEGFVARTLERFSTR